MIHLNSEVTGACKLRRLRRAWRFVLVLLIQRIVHTIMFFCHWSVLVLSDADVFVNFPMQKPVILHTWQPPVPTRTLCHVT